MLPVTWNADFDYPPAVAGMIADSMFTDKVSVPCGATPQPFGTVVASVPATGISVLPIGTNPVEGVAIKDDLLAGRLTAQDGYTQYDPMSVMNRGRIWALAAGACTKDGPAKYDPATGAFSDAATGTYPNARFVTANIAVPGIGGVGSQTIVQVELGDPSV